MHTGIEFSVMYRGEMRTVKTFRNEYSSLMALLYDRFYFEDFGDCRGIGRCGTCHVKIAQDNPNLVIRNGNEENTLSKMENVSANSRLSCQILITEAIHEQTIMIVDDGDLGLY